MERYTLSEFNNLDPISKARINILSTPLAPIFIHTSKGFINLRSITYVVEGETSYGPSIVVYLSCGSEILIEGQEEIENIKLLMPVLCRVFS